MNALIKHDNPIVPESGCSVKKKRKHKANCLSFRFFVFVEKQKCEKGFTDVISDGRRKR